MSLKIDKYITFVFWYVKIFVLLLGPEEYSIEIQNLVDIRTERNFEIAMKLSTNVKNEGIFYTDLNGYQVQAHSLLFSGFSEFL